MRDPDPQPFDSGSGSAYKAPPERRRFSHWLSAHAPGSATSGTALALPEGVHSPKAPRLWHCIGFAFSMCAAVLQCAPRARTKGRVMLRIRQSASKNAQATGAERERPCASRMPFPHQRLGFASHKAKRFQRHAGHGRGARKALRFAYAFPAPKAGECFA